MSKWSLTKFTLKAIITMLSKAVKKGGSTLKGRQQLKIAEMEGGRPLKKGKQYPEPINKPDPYQWPHQHDREWFLKEALKLMKVIEATSEINTIQFLYCIDATIQHILIHHNANLVKGENYFTFNWVLDLLSAAYGIPLLPDFPTMEAKEVTEFILYKKLPPLEHAS